MMNEYRRCLFFLVLWAAAIFSLSLLVGCKSLAPAPTEASPEASAPAPGAASVKYAWVQLGEQGAASARAIITSPDAACPEITINNQSSLRMSTRAVPSGYSGFQGITVCEHSLTPPVAQVSIGGATTIDLPAPTEASDKILVVGDTGCRLKNGKGQPCAGGSLARGQWGFPTLAVAAAAAPRPDLVLHVGDYLYRESTEPDGTTCDPYVPRKGWINCGYNWPTWEDDFFAPAEAAGLLRKAPWLYVRGNHEDCTRAWNGYFLFFYPAAAPARCIETIDPYPVNLTDLDVYVVDSSNEDPGSAATSFKTVFTDLAGSSTRTWLTTHVPTSELKPAYAQSGLALRQVLR